MEEADVVDIDGNPGIALRCFQLDFEKLKSAVEKAHANILSRQWNSKQTRAYLGRFCFNKSSQDDIIDCANNCAARQQAIADENHEAISAFNCLAEIEPEKYSKWNHPAIWNTDCSLQSATEPGMQQLFLGVQKSITLEIQAWASARQKYGNLKRQLELMTMSVE